MNGITLASIVFYLFSAGTLGSAAMVIAARNPVHAVLFLIFAFFNAAGLFILIGAEYLAMTLVIVYVGAVAVLFLFVVMMLNVNFAELRAGFVRQLPLSIAVAVILLVELVMMFRVSLEQGGIQKEIAQPIPDVAQVTNTQAIGNVLYTDYIYLFQLSGLVLLVAMIGAIVLTLRHREGVRRQQISRQVGRRREDSIEIVKQPTGEGV